MDEYVKRVKAIEAIDESLKRVFVVPVGKSIMDKVETADVRPERYAKKVKFYNEPWTGNKFTTCTACYGKVGPRDKFCKHCGAKFQEGETNDNHG